MRSPYAATAALETGRKPVALIALLLAAALVLVAPGQPPGTASAGEPVSVIVRQLPGAGSAAENLVERVGGSVLSRLSIINGFSASVPASALPLLQGLPGVFAVTEDAQVRVQAGSYDPASDTGSTHNTAEIVEADYLWGRGYTGEGIGVALIDTGVVPVEGLHDGVVHGPDLSFEGSNPDLRYLDTHGHGTHMAGIISGRDAGWSPGDPASFGGIAPDANLISVKVAVANGMADVSQVIAAIDWVVTHREELNIRVLNLAFGTDGIQDHRLDPLSHAVEHAWHKGIVVVASAGNSGFTGGRLKNPAYNPYVIAVGAVDPMGTKPTHDDIVPDWSNRGDGIRNPDVVAPGVSLVSLRNPGSYTDINHPGGRVGERFFRGSGTSQAAAVVSGAAALLIQQRPHLTPDQVKRLLTTSAVALPAADPQAQGNGLVNVKWASRALTPVYAQTWTKSTGLGLLDAARGTVRVGDGLEDLVGEIDVSGQLWDGLDVFTQMSAEVSWTGGEWSGNKWYGGEWMGNKWYGNKWYADAWLGEWTGNKWYGGEWTGNKWYADAWSSVMWE